MTVKCMCEGANQQCPRHLDSCCGVCDYRDMCKNTCEVYLCGGDKGAKNCVDAQPITGEVVAFQSAVPDTIKQITELVKLKTLLEEQEKQLKQQLVIAMESYGVKSFNNDAIKLTYVAPTTRTTIDSARLKKDHPSIAQQYSKVSNVGASVRIGLNGGGKR